MSKETEKLSQEELEKVWKTSKPATVFMATLKPLAVKAKGINAVEDGDNPHPKMLFFEVTSAKPEVGKVTVWASKKLVDQLDGDIKAFNKGLKSYDVLTFPPRGKYKDPCYVIPVSAADEEEDVDMSIFNNIVVDDEDSQD